MFPNLGEHNNKIKFINDSTCAGRISGLWFDRKPWLTDTLIRPMCIVTGSLETDVSILQTFIYI
jgi:hypothetical protein